MDICNLHYGPNCFHCENKKREFVIVYIGAGMDMEMLVRLGRKKIAIQCPFNDGYMVLELFKEQIMEITGDRLVDLNLLQEDNVSQFIKREELDKFLRNNFRQIAYSFPGKCVVLPPYP